MKKNWFVNISSITVAGILASTMAVWAADKVVVVPLNTCTKGYPCYPTEPCYTFDPATRNVGNCFDGKFLLYAATHSCQCVEQIGPREEFCDGTDNDCDGVIDEDAGCLCEVGEERFEDCGYLGQVDICKGTRVESYIHCCGINDPEEKVYLCVRGIGYPFKLDQPDMDNDGFSEPEDCNDGNPEIFPGADEICNTVDDDCDYIVDEGCPSF